MKKIITLIALLLYGYAAICQQWKWGKRGGGSGTYTETVVDMTIDPNNNIYVLSEVETSGLNVDGHSKIGYGSTDIMLASFTCDGVYRWSKVIGGWSTDIPASIKADSLGHIYVTGKVIPALGASQTNVHFDTDTTFTTFNVKRYLFVVQYDTSGTYKWLRMPQPDTLSTTNGLSNSQAIDVAIDDQENIDWLCMLPPGAFANGAYIVPSQGIYMLKYDHFGNFIQGFPFEISGTAVGYKMQRDPLTKRYYIAGNLSVGSLSMGGNPVTHAIYLGAFDSAGHYIWKREDNHAASGGGTVWRPAIDTSGNIFLSGSAVPGDTFNSYVFYNLGSSDPFVIKLDSNGTNIWAQSGYTEAAQGNAVTLTANNEVVLVGSYPAGVSWPGYNGWTPSHVTNQGYDMYVTRFSQKTGTVLGIDTLGSDFGVDDFASAIVADKKGNAYIGGQFGDQLYVAGNTLQSIGTPYDFVVAKYGFANCDCATLPTSSYTHTVNGTTHAASFTFTGTTPSDSVHWLFGDGSSATQTSPSHTYTTSGTYTACATVYTPCGSYTYCDTVQITVGVKNVSAFPDLSVYPNPANNVLHIDNMKAAANYRVLNIIGTTVQQSTLQAGGNSISTELLSSGLYMLELTNSNGAREILRVVKE